MRPYTERSATDATGSSQRPRRHTSSSFRDLHARRGFFRRRDDTASLRWMMAHADEERVTAISMLRFLTRTFNMTSADARPSFAAFITDEALAADLKVLVITALTREPSLLPACGNRCNAQ